MFFSGRYSLKSTICLKKPSNNICFAYSCIVFVQFSSEIQLFRLRVVVNATLFSLPFPKQPRFQANIPSNDGMLFVASKYGKRQLVMKNKPGDWSQSESAKYFE